MPKSRSRTPFSWKQEIGGVPVWGILVAVVAIAGMLAVPAVVNATTPAAAPYVRPSDAFDEQPTETVSIPKVAFIGDSWVGGTGADPSGPANGYAGLAATALGWPYQAFTGGGTGYTTGNANGEGPFGDRVDAVIQYAPDLVVVQGSSNDYRADAATIEAAATDVFTRLRAGLPDAEIIVLGAIDSPASPADIMPMIRSSVAAAATASGAQWIDGSGWLDVSTDFADGFHPNNAGHQKVADQLVIALNEWESAGR